MKITVVSTAHSEEDIDSTIEASREVMKSLKNKVYVLNQKNSRSAFHTRGIIGGRG
jgi:hypothetical protein